MGRIMAIDYGLKRTGIAVTDSHQIIATSLAVVETTSLISFLTDYFQRETVDEVVIGMPKKMNNQDSGMAGEIRRFISLFQEKFQTMPIIEADERFTSVLAQRAMIEGGMKKKQRRIKGNVDKISATLILQCYLDSPRKGNA